MQFFTLTIQVTNLVDMGYTLYVPMSKFILKRIFLRAELPRSFLFFRLADKIQ